MNYTIATLKEVQSEYEWEIFFDKDGIYYSVSCGYLENGKKCYKCKVFENKMLAVAFWNAQTLNILDSMYSKEQRLAQFN